MNFARHLLRRTTAVLTRPIVLPAAAPLRTVSTPIPRIPQILPRPPAQLQTRHESTAIGSLTGDPNAPSTSDKVEEVKPSYELTFTCRPCGLRSKHTVSKQGYHYGSVLITCPGCQNRHVISDHLMIFGETARSFEQILEQSGSGQKVTKLTAKYHASKELVEAEEVLRSRGIWSKDGTHVEVLPEGAEEGAMPVDEGWEKGLDAIGRNVYPDPDEEQPEGGSTAKVDGETADGAIQGAGRKDV